MVNGRKSLCVNTGKGLEERLRESSQKEKKKRKKNGKEGKKKGKKSPAAEGLPFRLPNAPKGGVKPNRKSGSSRRGSSKSIKKKKKRDTRRPKT